MNLIGHWDGWRLRYHTAVTDNFPSLTNKQSWANFNKWFRSCSPLYLPYECKLLCSYFSSPFGTVSHHLTQHVHGSENMNEKALWLHHSLNDVETSICHRRFYIWYKLCFLTLKLFEETPTKFLKPSNNCGELIWKFSQLFQGSSSQTAEVSQRRGIWCVCLPLVAAVATVQVHWGGPSSLLKGCVDPGFTQDSPDTCVPLWWSSGRLWNNKDKQSYNRDSSTNHSAHKLTL